MDSVQKAETVMKQLMFFFQLGTVAPIRTSRGLKQRCRTCGSLREHAELGKCKIALPQLRQMP